MKIIDIKYFFDRIYVRSDEQVPYSRETINEILLLIAQDKPIKEISAKYSISLATIYSWNRKYTNEIFLLRTLASSIKEIKRLLEEGKVEEALAITSEECFKANLSIQRERLTCLIMLERYDEAEALLNSPLFKGVSDLAYLKNKIKKGRLNPELIIFINKTCKKILFVIDTASISNYLQIEQDILASDIPEWQKVVLKCALYERISYPSKTILEYLSTESLIYAANRDISAIIQELINRAKIKNKLYDKEFYKRLLAKKVSLSDSPASEKSHLAKVAVNLVGETRKLK